MRSLYAKILLWCFATLLVSYVGFVAVTRSIEHHAMRPGGFLDPMRAMQIDEARRAYETGGAEKLAVYIEELKRFLPGEHYFTDAHGKDLVSGDDRSALLSKEPGRPGPPLHINGKDVFSDVSHDGRYWHIAVMEPPIRRGAFEPYFFLILAIVAVLCWLLAISIASPVRHLAQTVHRFGRGDLSARASIQRGDEIGELGRAFNEMAGRIQTLLTAERRLLQDISHELRSPLARLSFAAELTRTAQDRDAAAARLKKEIDRLTALVASLLEVTRAEGDPSTRHTEPLSFDRLVVDVIEDSRMEAEASRREIRSKIAEDITIYGDGELMRRAVENVVRNAIRHSPEGSSVDVTLESNDGSAIVCVRDYGPGVPESELAAIFKPFVRVDSARNAATGGVGLGLAIAERAVSLHHGTISAVNANPGLMVRITIPTAASMPSFESSRVLSKSKE